jgi:hypothetical protein
MKQNNEIFLFLDKSRSICEVLQLIKNMQELSVMWEHVKNELAPISTVLHGLGDSPMDTA